jgi:hydroxymethylbilane synthase
MNTDATTLRIGTRESKLSRLQTAYTIEQLTARFPGFAVEVVPITTSGCKIQDRPIAQLGGTGVFTKELEDALLARQVDLVVHSLKDLPTELVPGLILACVLDREDPRDVLVSNSGKKFLDLPRGARVATSSRRRAAMLRSIRQDLEFVDIRGNVDTRLRKQDEGACDAMILAAAGLLRLNLQDRITEFLDPTVCTPAAGQGALAIECRQDDSELIAALQTLENPLVREQITAERAFLAELGGGCSVPAGAYCIHDESGQLSLTVSVVSLDGKQVFRAHDRAPAAQAAALGKQLAEEMLKQGASEVLAALRATPPNEVSAP